MIIIILVYVIFYVLFLKWTKKKDGVIKQKIMQSS